MKLLDVDVKSALFFLTCKREKTLVIKSSNTSPLSKQAA